MKKIKMIVGALAITSLFVGCEEKTERASFEEGLKALGIPTAEVNSEPYYTQDTTTEEVTEVQEQIVEKVERFIEDEYNIALEDLVYLNDIVLGDGKTVHVFVNLRAYGENNVVDLYFKTLDGFEIGQISYNGGYAIYNGSANTVYVDLNEMNKLSDPLMSIKTTADIKYNPALQEWEEKKAKQHFTPINQP